jgi:hypothetical protein
MGVGEWMKNPTWGEADDGYRKMSLGSFLSLENTEEVGAASGWVCNTQ